MEDRPSLTLKKSILSPAESVITRIYTATSSTFGYIRRPESLSQKHLRGVAANRPVAGSKMY